MSTPAFKPSESKREEFRKYLEKNGVMDALTKVLVNLYEESTKPEDALEYIRDKLAKQAGLPTLSEMNVKNEELLAKIDELEEQINTLKCADENAEDGVPPADGEPLAEPAEGEAPAEGAEAPPAEGEAPAEGVEAPAEGAPEEV